jgi:hypothetical protein
MPEQVHVTEGTDEARQADGRKMNMRVLFWGVPAVVALFVLVAILWAGAA